MARAPSFSPAVGRNQEPQDNHTKNATAPRIPELHPAYMWPRRNARVAEALAALSQIDFVEFTQTRTIHGTQVMVLSVYLKRQPSRIPTNRSSRVGSIALVDHHTRAAMKPDYRLQKTLYEIQALRYESSVYAHQQCAKEPTCEYCAAFRNLTKKQYSHAKLWALLWPSSANRKKLLEGFVNDMVALSVYGLSSLQRSYRCAGFAHIPVRVHRFLRHH